MFSTGNFLKLLADAGDYLPIGRPSEPPSLQEACGKVLFHSSIIEGKEDNVRNLLKLGFDINVRFTQNKSALCLAVECGQAGVIDILISYGANANELHVSGISYLQYAINNFSSLTVVESLLIAGLDPNESVDGIPVLYKAAELNNVDLAEILLVYGAEIEVNNRNSSLIHSAVRRNSAEAIYCFSELGFDLDMLDSHSESPLSLAVKAGNVKIGKALVKSGANLYKRDSEGLTLLHCAAKNGNILALITLLDIGIDVNVPGGWWSWTSLHLAAAAGNLYIVEFLTKRGASTIVKASDGRTPLLIAISNGHGHVADYLKTFPSQDSELKTMKI